jgi:hypothetical protein
MTLAQTVTGATTWTDKPIVNDSVYAYQVASVGSWGVSPLSASQSAYPTALDWVYFPDFYFFNSTSMESFWITTCAATSTYYWGYSPNNLNHVEPVQYGGGGAVILTGLTPGVPIYYRVVADGGNGPIDTGVQTATP